MADETPNSDRWNAVRTLVERALEHPTEERGAFVAREANGDERLQAEVEELLDLDSTEGLDAPREDVADVFGGAPERLGAYRLLRELGRGGMGTVYLAVRDDGQFKKRVAVKVIKRGMDTDDVLRRFERERQVLANLDHPGIARLIDGGMSADELPYIVMEYVDGEPLGAWCDARRLSVRERIELFCQICDAVHHAHKSLVVHRDLKPGNVLVTSDGLPKLLDFGIAKVLDPEKGETTVDLTGTPLRMLTPSYASPEQIAGRPITTASDLYSLGAILYQLLVGRTPLEFETMSALEVERVVLDHEPIRPSRALTEEAVAERRGVTRRVLERTLRGDLDTVILKALRKEPQRRYSSAAELSDELRAYLLGLPVSARPDTVGYRCSKFVRRHAWPVATAAALLLALIASFVVSVVRGREAQLARDRLAEQLKVDRERNEELTRLTEELADERLVAEGRAGELEQLTEELQVQSEVIEERYEAVRSLASSMIFDVHRRLAPLEGSIEAKRLVIERSLPFIESLAEERFEPAIERELIGGYVRLANIQFDDVDENLGQPDLALANLGKAIERGNALLEKDPGVESNEFQVGSALQGRGDLYAMLGRTDDAIADYERTLELCGFGDADHAPVSGRTYMLATTMLRSARLDHDAGRLDRAEEYLFRARDLLEEMARTLPTIRTDLVQVLRSIAELYEYRLDKETAGEFWEEAVAIQVEVVQSNPTHAGAYRVLGIVQRELVGSFLRRERTEDAEELANVVQKRALARVERDPNGFQSRMELAYGFDVLATVAEAKEEWARADELHVEVLQLLADLVAEDPQNSYLPRVQGASLLSRSVTQRKLGEPLAAEETLREALSIHERQFRTDPAASSVRGALARTHLGLGTVYSELASADPDSSLAESWKGKARKHLDESLEIFSGFDSLPPATKRHVDRIYELLAELE